MLRQAADNWRIVFAKFSCTHASHSHFVLVSAKLCVTLELQELKKQDWEMHDMFVYFQVLLTWLTFFIHGQDPTL